MSSERRWAGMTTGYFRSVGGGRPTRTGTHEIGISFGAHRGMVREVAGRGERVDAPVGAVYVTVAHPITWSEVAEPVEALEVYPDPDLVRQCGGDPERVEASLGRPDLVVFGLASRLRAAHLGSAPLDELGGAELAQRVAAHLIAVHDRHQAPQRSPGRLDARVLRRVVEAIRSDPAHPPSLAALAQVAALSPFHLTRRFAATTGLTPHGYLTAVRLQTALGLLTRSAASVPDVALAVGYTNVGHFRRLFRRQYGAQPGQLAAELRTIGPSRAA